MSDHIALESAPSTAPPLPNYQRWLLGGAGAVAPLVVLGISVEWANVFINLTLLVALGYLVKGALLFLVGGFVGYLQRRETDQFKCFLIGISAPALITTASAASARAGDRLDDIANTIEVGTVASVFREGLIGQFNRGFSGSNPLNAVALVGTELDPEVARRSAAAVELFADCSIQGKTIPRSEPQIGFDEQRLRSQGLTSQTIVLKRETSPKYIVTLLLGNPQIAFTYLNVLRTWVPMNPVFVVDQAQAYKQVTRAIEGSTLPSLPQHFADILLKHVSPDCQVKM